MLVGLNNNELSKNISAHLGVLTTAINEHATSLHARAAEFKNFKEGLNKLSTEIDGLKLASANRAPSPNLYLLGLSLQFRIQPDELTGRLFKFIGLETELYKFHILETRKVNPRNPGNFSSYVIKSSSAPIADKILH